MSPRLVSSGEKGSYLKHAPVLGIWCRLPINGRVGGPVQCSEPFSRIQRAKALPGGKFRPRSPENFLRHNTTKMRTPTHSTNLMRIIIASSAREVRVLAAARVSTCFLAYHGLSLYITLA